MPIRIAFLFSAFLTLLSSNPVSAQADHYMTYKDVTYATFQDKKSKLWGFNEVKSSFAYGSTTKYKVRVRAQFEDIATQHYKGICAVKKDGKWGYINMKGDVVVPFAYEEANANYVKKDGKWGMIDENGAITVPISYAVLKSGGTLHIASRDGVKYGYIDDLGKVIIPFIYEECFPLVESFDILKTATGYATQSSVAVGKVKFKGKYGIIDVNNNYVLYPKFKVIYDDNTPYLRISFNGEDFGVTDRAGKVLMPTYFRDMSYVSKEGVAKASLYKENKFVSAGVLNVTDKSYKWDSGSLTYTTVGQKYLNRKDSVTFGLYRAEDIKAYQKNPSGFLAFCIAEDFLGDSLNSEILWPEGIKWLREGIDNRHDPICALKLSEIVRYGRYYTTLDMKKSLDIAEQGLTYLVKHPEILDDYYEFTADDEDYQDMIFDMVNDSFFLLAYHYMKGKYFEKNEQQAIYWYEKGVSFGSAASAVALGDLYYNGSAAIPKDYKKALNYYENGPEAQYNSELLYKAGKMYLEGLGTDKNREKAIALLQKSASFYNKDAKELLAKIGEK